MNAPSNPIYEFGPFLLEPHARRLSRNGQSVPLAASEFELLLLLVRNRGRVVEKREIMDAVWPDVEVEEKNLTVRMSALRKALGETKGNHQYIQTVTGRGYCLVAEVKELPTQPITEAPEPVSDNHRLRGSNAESKSNEEPLSSGSDVVQQSKDSFPLNTPGRKQRFTLYAILAIALLVPLLVYLVWRLQKASDSEAPAQSMKMSRFTQTGRVQSIGLSPDGQNIAYVERDGELSSLWLQRVGTTNPLQLIPPATGFLRDPSFTRDGNTIYYVKCQGGCQLHRIPVLGGVETPLGIRSDSRVTFSPDGRRMAYVRNALEAGGQTVVVRAFVANIDGTGEMPLNWEGGGTSYQGGSPAWSPDGKVVALSILVTEGVRKFMKVIGLGVDDRTQSTLIDSWSLIRDVAWLPDGRSLIVNGRGDASAPEAGMQIWRVSLTGGEPRRITNDLMNYPYISLSVDGSTLIALQWTSTAGLWIAPTENPSAAVQVTAPTLDRQDGKLGLSMSPNGRLVYVSDHNGKKDLWSINADGTGLKQLTDGHRNHFPSVSPDGRYVVFQGPHHVDTRDGVYNLWRVDVDGRNLKRLTYGRYDDEPVVSADSQWVIYRSDEDRVPKLRKVPIGGGVTTLLTDEFAQHPAISPDGKTIAYYRMNMQQRDQRHIVLIPAEGGAAIKTIPAPKNFGPVMRWSPTGDSISYRDNAFTSIWKLPLDGTPPSPLLQLRNQLLSTFCYSRDGRRLVYSSGTELRDVVLITRFN